MDFSTVINTGELAQVKTHVESYNKSIAVNGRAANQQLGKDDFLKLLITQLSNQDPLSPMENTEFIAQMAQFSSLEQMTNMSTQFSKLSAMVNESRATEFLGKTVDITNGDVTVTGVVEAAMRGDNPQVRVNGRYYDMSQIATIYDN